MGLGTGLFLGGIVCVLIVWYLYRRSKNDTSEDTEQQTDEAGKLGDDEYEDLLLTGLVLDEVYNDDDDSSDNMDANGHDSMDDGGGFDDSGFE